MAQGTTKITQISKDFEMKSKDVLDALREMGIDKKSGGSLEAGELEIFINRLTTSKQIGDLDGYRSGKVTIKVKHEKKAAPAEAKAPEKEAVKAPAEAKPPVAEKVADKAAVPSPAPAKAAETKAPAANAPTANAGRSDAQREPARPAAGQAQRPAPQGQPARDGRRDQNGRPADNRQGDRRPQGGYGQQNGGSRQDGKPRFDRDRYTGRPQENPFAKRAEGYKNPNAPKPKPWQMQTPKPAAKPEAQKPATPAKQPAKPQAQQELPAQRAALERAKAAAEKAAAMQKRLADAQTAQKPAEKKEEKKAQRQSMRTITPSVNPSAKGGVNIGGESTEVKAKTRVVDMRTSDVNLSKYDDRFNEQYLAIARGTDGKAAKQKLKKQDNKGQFQKSAKDKERAAQEKIKRLEAEKARKKQLEITVPDEITVTELASRLKKTSAEVIKKLMLMGEMKGVNDVVDYATAELVADAFGAKVTKEVVVTIEEKLFTEAEDNEEDLVERAPVVCVMGHVDHGKTSILDAIRHTNVTRGEAGGITQAIGAYRVKVNGKDITFLDTPGHEAFTAMRMRGAKSTDIAILVVAADDGVMPQTIEAINHAKAAGIDIIVAINKMDKPHANPDNVMNQLTQYDIVPEAWGGDAICVPVSAVTGQGIKELLESVLLVAEVKELRANPKKRAKGIVIESKLDRGRGPVATVLVQNGTLHQGDYVIVGNAVGRVRAMVDDNGKNIKSAGPSVPVEIIGLDDVPQAGDEMNAVEDERMAKSLADQRREKQRADILAANARVNLDELFSQISDGVKTLNIIVKADVAGSAEAVKASLLKLSGDEVKINVIHSAVGGITESDVMLAAASNAVIVGFNVRPDKNALDSAERNGVDIRTHRIIYEIIDEISAAMKGMLDPTYREVLLGHADVRQTIHVPNVGTIAGCYIQDGKITRQSLIRIIRDGVVISEDKVSSLKRFKDDAREVATGFECGVGLEKFNDIKVGDILEAYIMEEVAR